jgi:uncharacterized membrane protein
MNARQDGLDTYLRQQQKQGPWILLGLAICVGLSDYANAAPSFQGIGDLPGGTFNSEATYISPDGNTVLGNSQTGAGGVKFIWTAPGGMTELSLFPDGDFSSGFPVAITDDHSVIVGSGQSSFGTEAFRWTPVGGASGLGDLPGGVFRSVPSAMSSNGSVIVGKGTIGPDPSTDTEAFIWTEVNGLVGLGDLPTGPDRSWAADVSADGTVVVGIGTVVTFPGEPWESYDSRAFRWTETGGMVDLGTPDFSVRDPRISADGNVIVAYTVEPGGDQNPFRWSQGAGWVPLSDPLGGGVLAHPVDLSADGSVIAGFTFTTSAPFGPHAVIWDDLNGQRLLDNVLTDLGLDLTGWTLEKVTGISDDGLTIVGTGINPNGDTEAFIATLPEPRALAVIVLGIPALLRRRGE